MERQGADVLTGGPGGPFGPRSPWKAGGKAGQWVSGGCWGPSGSGTGQMVRGCDQLPGPRDAGPPPSASPQVSPRAPLPALTHVPSCLWVGGFGQPQKIHPSRWERGRGWRWTLTSMPSMPGTPGGPGGPGGPCSPGGPL